MTRAYEVRADTPADGSPDAAGHPATGYLAPPRRRGATRTR
ncbi:hypothetical protein ABZX90_03395 [Streptomyces sp. NPDC002935]